LGAAKQSNGLVKTTKTYSVELLQRMKNGKQSAMGKRAW